MIPINFYKNNLEFYPKDNDLFGNGVLKKKMKDRLGFLPISCWEPDIALTKELKDLIGDKAQVRKTLNAKREDRRGGINSGKCSVFNPQLAQMILAAYCPLKANIYDPFCGGGTRGYIATKMGHEYYGVEIREEEVNRIKEKFNDWGISFNIILGDSRNHRPGILFDFSLTCPPYYDLERYSQISGDLSNYSTYNKYLKELKKVMENVYTSLKEGSLSVWVVGNFRNKTGELEHLNGDLVKLGKEVGFKFWDELIWKGASPVALTRCGNFEANRKCVRMHEYVIILKK